MDKFPEEELAKLKSNGAEIYAAAARINTTMIQAVRVSKSICREIDVKRRENIGILDKVITRAKSYHADQKRRATMGEEDLGDYWAWIGELEDLLNEHKTTETDIFDSNQGGWDTERVRTLARYILEELFEKPGSAV